jgi:molecular chaperone GrpE
MSKQEVPKEEDGNSKSYVIKDKRHWAENRPGDDSADPSGAAPGKLKYVQDLEEQLKTAQQKVSQIRQAHTESAAEFEKAKQRLRRNTEEEVERARLQVATSLFELADNLERVVEGMRKGGTLEALSDGVSLVRDQFFQAMDQFGVERFSPLGEPFDPNKHDAMGMVPVDDPTQHKIIIEVHQPGFRAGETILRPAVVLVGQASTPAGAEDDNTQDGS